LSSEWQEHRVDSLIKNGVLTIGDGYRAKNVELASTGIPFARVSNIDNGFDFSGADLFPEDGLYKVGEKISRPGDVVFTSKGTVGRFAFVGEETPRFVYSPQLSYWRSLDFNHIDPHYLFYWMQSWEFEEQAESVKSQTDMADYVSLRDQRRMKVTLPSLNEQHAIARILGALDDKIELNHRMNRTLEAMAHAIFKSWFVDLYPVTAKADGRMPYGMDAETAALFPSAFEETELGPIPKMWKIGNIEDEFDLIMGQSPPGSTYNEIGEGIVFYQGRTDFGSRYPTPRIYCTAPTRFANPGDTLVSVRAPVGDINMALEKLSIGRGLASIRHKSGSRSFTYYTMHFLRDKFDVFEGEGTLFGSISGSGFRNIKIVIPPNELVEIFEKKIYPLDQTIENNEQQMLTLASIRDALLPQLLSGGIRVKL
jgi:type I restriction enzyme, S subunit